MESAEGVEAVSTQAERIKVAIDRLYADAMSADALTAVRIILDESSHEDTDDDSISVSEWHAYDDHVSAFEGVHETRIALVSANVEKPATK